MWTFYSRCGNTTSAKTWRNLGYCFLFNWLGACRLAFWFIARVGPPREMLQMNRSVLLIICDRDGMAFHDQLLIIKISLHDVCERASSQPNLVFMIQGKSWPYCTCSLREEESKHGWDLYIKKHKRVKKKSWNKPHFLASILPPSFVSDIIMINVTREVLGQMWAADSRAAEVSALQISNLQQAVDWPWTDCLQRASAEQHGAFFLCLVA